MRKYVQLVSYSLNCCALQVPGLVWLRFYWCVGASIARVVWNINHIPYSKDIVVTTVLLFLKQHRLNKLNDFKINHTHLLFCLDQSINIGNV